MDVSSIGMTQTVIAAGMTLAGLTVAIVRDTRRRISSEAR